jgi:hypothetical protein
MAKSDRSPTKKREILSTIAEASQLIRRQVTSEDSGQVNESFVVKTTKGKGKFMGRVFKWMCIISFLGLILGTASYFCFMKYRPAYTAQAGIEVIPPNSDPLNWSNSMPDRETMYQLRMTKAAMIKSEGLFLNDLLRDEKIRNTLWFHQLGNNASSMSEDIPSRATKALKKNLNVVVPKGSGNFITVELTCYGNSGKHESALILESILQIFLDQQRDMAGSNLVGKKAGLDYYRKELQGHVDEIDRHINSLYKQAQVPDFDTSPGDHYLNTVLTQLELNKMDLAGQIAGLEKTLSFLDTNSKSASAGESKIDQNAQPAKENKLDKNESATTKLTNAKQDLAVLNERHSLLNKQIAETEERLNQVVANHWVIEKTKAIRDERQKEFNAVNSSISKLELWMTSPDMAGIRLFRAIEPEDTSSPIWAFHYLGWTALLIILFVGVSIFRKMNAHSKPMAPAVCSQDSQIPVPE